MHWWSTIFGIAIVMWVAAEIISFLALDTVGRRFGLRFLPKNNPSLSAYCTEFYKNLISTNGIGKILELHAELGWIVRSNLTDEDGRKVTNSGRARGPREYSRTPGKNIVRVSTYGDCLTFGTGVSAEETWQSRMEQIDPVYEVLNFGTNSYCPGQMYLRYLESLKAYPQFDIAIFSVVSTNVFKSLSVFRPFYAYDHGLPFGKPGFRLERHALRCIPNPLPSLSSYQELLSNPKRTLERMGQEDYYFGIDYREGCFDKLPSLRLLKILFHELYKFSQVFNLGGQLKEDSTAFEVTTAIFDTFYEISKQHGSTPLFLLIPLGKEVKKYLLKNVKPYQAIIDHFNRSSYQYLDLLEVIGGNSCELSSLFVDGRHFSSKANWIIARGIVDYLRKNSSCER